MTTILLYLLCGAAAGFTAGLFGVGGGLIIVPTLLWLFHLQGFDISYSTHLAIGTSLAIIMITSISSIKAHHAKKAVRWDIFKHLCAGLIIGSLCGAWIAKLLPSNYLQLIIGCFAWWVAINMLRSVNHKNTANNNADKEHLPSPIAQTMAGGVIGIASAIFGIGGGTLTVPYLSRYGVPIQKAVGTAAAGGFPIAIAGALGFILFGTHITNLPKYAWGFVYLPAFFGISISSVFTAQLGAKLAHHLPSNKLKQAFSALLFIVGSIFIIKAWQSFFG